jgi:hypothetical protein
MRQLGHQRTRQVKVSTLVTAFVLLMTVSLAVAVGVGTGYLLISGILSAFAHKPKQVEAVPAMVAHGVTGD